MFGSGSHAIGEAQPGASRPAGIFGVGPARGRGWSVTRTGGGFRRSRLEPPLDELDEGQVGGDEHDQQQPEGRRQRREAEHRAERAERDHDGGRERGDDRAEERPAGRLRQNGLSGSGSPARRGPG